MTSLLWQQQFLLWFALPNFGHFLKIGQKCQWCSFWCYAKICKQTRTGHKSLDVISVEKSCQHLSNLPLGGVMSYLQSIRAPYGDSSRPRPGAANDCHSYLLGRYLVWIKVSEVIVSDKSMQMIAFSLKRTFLETCLDNGSPRIS